MSKSLRILNTPESRIVVSEIVAGLKDGQEVKITGFGIILLKDTAARQARNPKTGEAISVPAGKKIKVRISKTLKDLVL